MGRDWLALSDEAAVELNVSVRRPRMIDVLNAVCLVSGIPSDAIRSLRRSQPIASTRQLVMLLLRDECVSRSLPEIGRFLGRDHTTVIHGCKVAAARVEDEPEYRELYEAAKQHLHSVRRAA